MGPNMMFSQVSVVLVCLYFTLLSLADVVALYKDCLLYTSPESTKKYIESWKKFCPEYAIKEWNEHNFDINSVSYTHLP